MILSMFYRRLPWQYFKTGTSAPLEEVYRTGTYPSNELSEFLSTSACFALLYSYVQFVYTSVEFYFTLFRMRKFWHTCWLHCVSATSVLCKPADVRATLRGTTYIARCLDYLAVKGISPRCNTQAYRFVYFHHCRPIISCHLDYLVFLQCFQLFSILLVCYSCCIVSTLWS